LLENIELKNAKGILVNISASSSFKMKEYIDVMNEVKSITANDATVIVGNVIDDELENKIKVTIVATGLDDNYISEIKDQPPLPDDEVIDHDRSFDDTKTTHVIEKSASNESDFSNVFFDGGDESSLVDNGSVSEDEYDIPSFLRRNK
jgi:cell division protein FtsZ